MQVLLHAPAAWYLLKKDEAYYLDVACAQSAAGFNLFIALSEDEYTEYHALGRVYLDYLAARINHWSPQYAPRNVQGLLAKEAHAAIMAWRHAQGMANS
jgi:hypothetical protein